MEGAACRCTSRGEIHAHCPQGTPHTGHRCRGPSTQVDIQPCVWREAWVDLLTSNISVDVSTYKFPILSWIVLE